MKKHLIAAAVAGALAVPAMAQVTVSGTLDIAATENRKVTSNVEDGEGKSNNTGEPSGYSTSTFNVSGSEDLGGGLKAGFFWNQTINADSGAEGAREGYLTLDGSFGQFKIGRFTPATEAAAGTFITGTTNQPGTPDGTLFSVFSGVGGDLEDLGVVDLGIPDFGRNGGNIQYTSPSLSGLKLVVGLNSESEDTEGTEGKAKNEQYDLAAHYGSGPLKVAFGYAQSKENAEGDDSIDSKLMILGGSFDMGMAVVRAGYFDRNDEEDEVVDADFKGFVVGADVKLGATTVYATYTDAEFDDKLADTKSDLKHYQVGLRYALSKRTGLYAVYGSEDIDIGDGDDAIDAKLTGYAIGVTHKF